MWLLGASFILLVDFFFIETLHVISRAFIWRIWMDVSQENTGENQR